MVCRCSGPCNCGCSPPTNSSSGGGGTGGSGGGGTNTDGTICTDPGILPRGIPLIADEDFCTRRTRTWRGTDPSGNPITDPAAPAVPGFYVQGSDGLTGFTNQPCVEFPELEAYTYGAFVDSIMGRKDGCEFDVKGKAGTPAVMFWDGKQIQFVEPKDIDFGPGDCAILGSTLTLDTSLTSYSVTVSDGIENLGKDLSVNVGTHQMVVSDILDQATGAIKLDLLEPHYGSPVTIPIGTSICPIGFIPESKLYPVIDPTEMTTGPKIILQLPNKKFRRMSNPDASIGVPVLAYDKVNGGLKWVNLVTSPGGTQTVAYQFTGKQQQLTVPAWAIKMQFYIWGGAGTTDSYAYGGVGGFVTGFVTVAGGQQYAIVVGGGGPTYRTGEPVYLGGGMMSGDGHQGPAGGLSGIFSGINTITSLDKDKAIAIAGGGGAGSSTDRNVGAIAGVPGGWDGGGAVFTSTMAGANGTNGQFQGSGAGGGGYQGGGAQGRAGWGGKSFLNTTDVPGVRPAVQAGQILVGTAGNPTVPMSSSPFYVTGVAGISYPPGGLNIAPGGNGLVVVEFS